MERFKTVFVSIVVSLVIMVGCSSSPSSPVATGSQSLQSSGMLVDQYRIGVDDQVQVSVWKNPELSITVPVRPDGKISVPLVGEVLAGGRTPEEVAEEITQRLNSFIRDPQVAVILVNLLSHEFLSRVRVAGAVKSPVSLPYRQGMTVLDVVLVAGGLNDFASGNGAKLYRQTDEGVQTISIKLTDIMNKGKMSTNVQVLPGDVLTVPERVF
ncbi:exopolysaccharide export protein VpsN [Aurantivibrio infirmus]